VKDPTLPLLERQETYTNLISDCLVVFVDCSYFCDGLRTWRLSFLSTLPGNKFLALSMLMKLFRGPLARPLIYSLAHS
jgi:hypothetical protein